MTTATTGSGKSGRASAADQKGKAGQRDAPFSQEKGSQTSVYRYVGSEDSTAAVDLDSVFCTLCCDVLAIAWADISGRVKMHAIVDAATRMAWMRRFQRHPMFASAYAPAKPPKPGPPKALIQYAAKYRP